RPRGRRRSCRPLRRGRARRPRGSRAALPLDEPAQVVDVVRALARRVSGSEPALALLALARGGQDPVDAARPDHDRAVGVEDDNVAPLDPGAADDDRDVELAGSLLRGSLRADVAGPDGEPDLAELLDVADRRIDEDPGDALVERLRREQVADDRDRRRV